jgi:hypothetical protein
MLEEFDKINFDARVNIRLVQQVFSPSLEASSLEYTGAPYFSIVLVLR